MKAYTYVKPGLASFVDVDKPVIRKPTDAIVRIVKTTICGTDLHICLLYTSPSPRDRSVSRMPSSA